jgi:hypothetical protein
MRDTDFNRHFDLDRMLNEDAVWLSVQVKLPVKGFLKIADQLDLRQEDWDTFWKRTRNTKEEVGKIQCDISGREYEFTENEFEVAKQVLNCMHPEEVSNCCSAGIFPHNANDHTSRCKDCGEGCGIVYIF